MVRTTFEYLYRDAANFKAFGSFILEGRLDDTERQTIHGKLESGELFVAEQIGVPPLYDQLYRWSDGPTSADHCWHEFVGFRELIEAGPAQLMAQEFVARFESIEAWDQDLSSHSGLVDSGWNQT